LESDALNWGSDSALGARADTVFVFVFVFVGLSKGVTMLGSCCHLFLSRALDTSLLAPLFGATAAHNIICACTPVVAVTFQDDKYLGGLSYNTEEFKAVLAAGVSQATDGKPISFVAVADARQRPVVFEEEVAFADMVVSTEHARLQLQASVRL
jgi:hypothetical protein